MLAAIFFFICKDEHLLLAYHQEGLIKALWRLSSI